MAKKKINDDTLLQLIRDGNSPAGAAHRFEVGRAAVFKRLKAFGFSLFIGHCASSQKIGRELGTHKRSCPDWKHIYQRLEC